MLDPSKRRCDWCNPAFQQTVSETVRIQIDLDQSAIRIFVGLGQAMVGVLLPITFCPRCGQRVSPCVKTGKPGALNCDKLRIDGSV